MCPRQAVLQTPPLLICPSQLPSCQQSASVNPLDATLAGRLASAVNKRLTENLNPVDATLTKNRGVGVLLPKDLNYLFNVSPNDQKVSRSFFSTTYKLLIFYPLCFDIHPSNRGVYPPPNIPTFEPSNIQNAASALTSLLHYFQHPASAPNTELSPA